MSAQEYYLSSKKVFGEDSQITRFISLMNCLAQVNGLCFILSTPIVDSAIEVKYGFPNQSFVLYKSYISFKISDINEQFEVSTVGENCKNELNFKLLKVSDELQNLDFSNLSWVDPFFKNAQTNLIDKIQFPSGGKKSPYDFLKVEPKIFGQVIESETKNMKTVEYSGLSSHNNQMPLPLGIKNFNISSDLGFNSTSSNNPFFKDSNSGYSGNLVGPNSSIFTGAYSRQGQNLSGENSLLMNKRYDPIGPMGFGGEEMPDFEQRLFGLGGNSLDPNVDFDLVPQALLYEQDGKFGKKQRKFP